MPKEDALDLIRELRGTVEYKLPHADPECILPELLDMLDNLKETVESIDECGCSK